MNQLSEYFREIHKSQLKLYMLYAKRGMDLTKQNEEGWNERVEL